MRPTAKLRWDIPLILIALLSAFFNGYNIWDERYVNTYYTTTVASMMQSLHNFFFASLDSAGFVTVDKPPVTFWIQTLSAELFGLHGWSVILPQALAGIGSVLLLYVLIKPTFGLAAARISALVMACSPVAVAVSRTNNIDSMLVFTLLLAAWLLFRGIKHNKSGCLIGAFAVIGIAFNMKMLQAYMVVPALLVLIVIAWQVKRKRKISVIAGAVAVMLMVSFSWAVIVDFIPEDQRPYIGSSNTDSVLELALGYNGISRLTGDKGGGGAPSQVRNAGGMPIGGFIGGGADRDQRDGQSNQTRPDQERGMPPGDAPSREQALGTKGDQAPINGNSSNPREAIGSRDGNRGFAGGGG
ncbi:MAG: glycosyltransferase family 39 protein, partial [Gorillibacterium sp.]|nr:glycosyltransferase family 39 protein [Gorillibacterium sp.]